MDTSEADFVLKRGDRLPVIETILTEEDGTPAPLAGGPVLFKMRKMGGGEVLISAAATIVNPPGTDGRVRYAWDADDTTTPGWYEAEWEATISGLPATFPTEGYHRIAIVPDVS